MSPPPARSRVALTFLLLGLLVACALFWVAPRSPEAELPTRTPDPPAYLSMSNPAAVGAEVHPNQNLQVERSVLSHKPRPQPITPSPPAVVPPKPSAPPPPPHLDDTAQVPTRVSTRVTRPRPLPAGEVAQRGEGSDVQLEAELSSGDLLQTGQQKLVYLLIDVNAKSSVKIQAIPSNIALVIDTSGSMAGKKLDYAIAAVTQALGRMRPVDNCSVVVFAERAQVVETWTPESDTRVVGPRIRAATVGQGTNMLTGIELALEEIRANQGKDKLNHILLMTDGVTSSERECAEACHTASKSGVTFSTIGLGYDCNRRFLEGIAEQCGGKNYFISRFEEIPRVFDQELEGVRNTLVRNTRLQLKLEKGVEVRRAYRFKPTIRDLGEPPAPHGVVTLPMGDARKGEKLTVLFELALPRGGAGRVRVLQARVEHDRVRDGVEPVNPFEEVWVRYSSNPTLTSRVNTKVMDAVDAVTMFKQKR